MTADGVRVIDRRTFSPVYEMGRLKKTLLVPIAYPLSLVYAAGVRLWRRRRVHAEDIGLPVVSVGSISVGGTGKTPLSMLIASHLTSRGKKVAVVSRGYKRKGGPSPLVVSDYDGVRAGVEEAGDEPYLMASRRTGVAVVIDSNRLRGAEYARDALGPDVVLLDDGFQCRAIRKRLDIVTVGLDALAPGAAYLPWGPLREGLDAIGPEDLVVYVARSDIEKRVADGGGPGWPLAALKRRGDFYVASYVDPVIVDAAGEAAGPAADLGRAVVVSGIARPEGFEATCDNLGIAAAAIIRFDDHHWYGGADRSMIEKVMEELGCEYIATTEKDLLRMPGPLRERALAVRISMKVEGRDFLERVAERVNAGE
ncbi:MAG: tetraacyldisaccharide 4'-kinase [bacterium]